MLPFASFQRNGALAPGHLRPREPFSANSDSAPTGGLEFMADVGNEVAAHGIDSSALPPNRRRGSAAHLFPAVPRAPAIREVLDRAVDDEPASPVHVRRHRPRPCPPSEQCPPPSWNFCSRARATRPARLPAEPLHPVPRQSRQMARQTAPNDFVRNSRSKFEASITSSVPRRRMATTAQ